MKGLLLDSDYLKNRAPPAMRLFLKKEGEVFTIMDPHFHHYFYVEAENPERTAEMIRKVEAERGEKTVRSKSVEVLKRRLLGEEKRVIKIVVRDPKDITPLRRQISNFPDVIEIYEYDLPPARRYLADRGLTSMSGVEVEGELREEERGKELIAVKPPKPAGEIEMDLNVMCFDIEAYEPSGQPQAERNPIIIISVADNRGLERVLTWKDFDASSGNVEVLKDEREMLKRFVRLVREREVDVLLGYNTDLFDFPYLKERAKQLDVKLKLGRDGSEITSQRRRFATVTRIAGRVHADVYAMVDFLSRIGAIKLIDYTLESVYKHVLDREKPDLEPADLSKAWEEGGEKGRKLLEYSLSDSKAGLELGLEFLPLFVELSRTVKQSLFDVTRMTPGQLVEWLLIFNAHRIDELVPARPGERKYRARRGKSYVGGYVMEPEKGLHENLVVFDFRSLYPTIITTHNIDPATIDCDCCGPDEASIAPELRYRFCQKKEGFIPATLENLIDSRTELKGKMGELDEGSREYRSIHNRQWALKIIANSFYGMYGYSRARWYSKECAESITSFGRHYIKNTIEMAKEEGFEVIYGDTDSSFCKLNGKAREDVVKFLNKVNESLPGVMELELEDFYKRGVFVTKKRYAMINEQEKIVVKGLEFVRRDWAPLAKRTQEKVLEAVLHDASPEKAADIVRETTKSVEKEEVDLNDLIIRTQLKKPIEDYKSRAPHVAAAERLRACGEEVEPGTPITYIIENGDKSISDRAIPVAEFGDREYDPDYYVEHQILPAVMRIMEVLDYTEEDLRWTQTKQMKLGKFE